MVLVVGRMVNRVIEEADTQNMRFGSSIVYEVKDAQKKYVLLLFLSFK
jgi:hypothetical protein